MFLITHQYIFHYLEKDLFFGNYTYFCVPGKMLTPMRCDKITWKTAQRDLTHFVKHVIRQLSTSEDVKWQQQSKNTYSQ